MMYALDMKNRKELRKGKVTSVEEEDKLKITYRVFLVPCLSNQGANEEEGDDALDDIPR